MDGVVGTAADDQYRAARAWHLPSLLLCRQQPTASCHVSLRSIGDEKLFM